MKKLIIFVMLILISIIANARLVVLDSSAVLEKHPSAQLYDALRELSTHGAKVYHYNYDKILVDMDELLLSGYSQTDFQTISLPSGQELYLISRLDNQPDPTGLDLIADFGTSLLVKSEKSDLELRSQIMNPVLLISNEAIKFSQKKQVLSRAVEETRTTITQLVQAVDADSVLNFIQHLQDFQTRYALASNRLEVANWIKNKFISFGITDVSLHEFGWNNTTQYNVVATIPGIAAPSEYIIVGGHHDSISSGDPFTFAPGADDNASGTVAALEMARVMMSTGYQPKCSIRFITFAAEEFGLWGAKAYAAYADNNDLAIRIMMNHDMIANSPQAPGAWQVRLMPYDGFYEQSVYAAQMTEQYTSLSPTYGNLNSSSSDSHPFWQRGFPVVYFFEQIFCPFYHSPQDITANLNPDYCAEVIRASVATAAGFASMPSAPTNLILQDVGNGTQLQVSWTLPNDPDVIHYNVYYGTSPNNLGEAIVTTNSSITLSNLVEGQQYYVFVAAEDASDNESYRISGSCTPNSIPLSPANFSETPVIDAIRLSWSANNELDFGGYVLYKSQNPNQIGNPVQPGLIMQTEFIDANVNGSSGYYYYTLIALDNDGNPSPYTQTLSSRPITLDQGILLVDETKNLGGTSLFQITDEQADSFYNDLLEGRVVHSFDTETNEALLRLADIGIYETIIWHAHDISDMDYPYNIKPALQAYLNAGGNILFTVMVPSQAFELSATYPANFNANTFINSNLGIAGVDYTVSARFKSAIPSLQGLPPLQIDPTKIPSSMNGHIIKVEGLNPTANSTPLYSYDSDYDSSTPQGVLNGMTVAVMNETNGKAVTLSFPLYYMEQTGVQQFIDIVLNDYFASTANDDDVYTQSPQLIKLTNNYPNPFTHITRFSVESKLPNVDTSISIYNTRGQLVRSIYSGELAKGINQFEWDSRDESGRSCSSGIYFIKANQDNAQATIKVLLIK